MNSLFSRDLCATLMLSFGHFLWIGTVIAVVAALVARRQRTAATRYGVWLAALVTMAVSPFVTLIVMLTMSLDAPVAAESKPRSAQSSATQKPESNQGVIDIEQLVDSPSPVEVQSAKGERRANDTSSNSAEEQGSDLAPPIAAPPESALWRNYAPLVTQLYLIGVALMGLRLAVGLWGGRRLRHRARLITDHALLDALQRQADALRLKFVPAMAYCEKVTVPTVLGILKPMILLPVSVASGLTPEQVESVLAHELAHLQRYDHLVNLMQCVIESLLFFHPAVWWVSRRIRDEREHCCDDLVIACGAVPLDYANSLLRVAELSREAERNQDHNQRRFFTAVSHFATGDRPSTLRQRIARLLGDPLDTHIRLSSRSLLAAASVLLSGLLIALWLSPIGESTEEPKPQLNVPKANEVEVARDDAVENSAETFTEQQIAMRGLRDRIRKVVPKGWQVEYHFGSIWIDRPGRIRDTPWAQAPDMTIYFSQEEGASTAAPQIEGTARTEALGLCKLGYALAWVMESVRTEWPEYREQVTALLPEADAAAVKSVQEPESWVTVEGRLLYKYGSPVAGALVGPTNQTKVPLSADGRYRARVNPNWGSLSVSLLDAQDWPSTKSLPRDPSHKSEYLTIYVGEHNQPVLHRDITLNRTNLRTVKLLWNGVDTAARLTVAVIPPDNWSTGDETQAEAEATLRSQRRERLRASRQLDVQLKHGESITLPDVPPGEGYLSIVSIKTMQPFVWPLTDDEADEKLVYHPDDVGSVEFRIAGANDRPQTLPVMFTLSRSLPHVSHGIYQSAAVNQPEVHRPVFNVETQTHRVSNLQPGSYQVDLISEGGGWRPHAFTVVRGETATVELQLPEITKAPPIERGAIAPEQPKTDGHPNQRPANTKPQRYVANLPDGRSVEFVGITKNTRPAMEGWRPDGRAIGEVGYWPSTTVLHNKNTSASYVENGPHPEPDADAVDFLFRFRSLKSQPSLTFDLPTTGSSYSHLPLKEPYELRVSGRLRGEPSPVAKWSLPDGVARIGLTDEPWGKWLQVGPTGEVLNPLTDEDLHRSSYEQIQIERVEPHERAPNRIALVLQHPKNRSSLFAFQIRGIDPVGKEQWVLEWEGRGIEGTDRTEGRWGLASSETKPLVRYEYRLRPYRHWVTFNGVGVESGKETDVTVTVASLPIERPKPKQYAAKLSNGGQVELVGVAATTAVRSDGVTRRNDNVWWRPDGTRFETPPDVPSFKPVAGPRQARGPRERDFLLKVSGVEPTFGAWAVVGRSSPMRMERSPSRSESEKATLVRINAAVTEDESTEVWFVVAHDEYGPVQTISPQGKLLGTVTPPEDLREWYSSIQPLKVDQEGETTRLWLTISKDRISTAIDLPFSAIDVDGKSHPSTSLQTRGGRHTAEFPLPAERVARFEYKLRPYRTWITFQNVSLDEGHSTNIVVQTKSLEELQRKWQRPQDGTPTVEDQVQRDRAADERATASLEEQTEIAFVDTPLNDALGFLRDLHGIEIHLDPTAEAKLGGADSKLLTIRSSIHDLGSALALILHPLELVHFVEQGRIVIATPDEARRRGGRVSSKFAETLKRLSKYDDVRWIPILRGDIGEQDLNAIPRLIAATSDPDPTVQREAARALAQIGPNLPEAVAALKRVTDSPDWRTRMVAYHALVVVGKDDPATLFFILDAWSDDEVVRNEFGRLLLPITNKGIHELEKRYETALPDFRIALIRGATNPFVNSTERTEESLVLLGLKDADSRVRQCAVNWVGRFRDLAPYFAALKPLMNDADSDNRLMAALYLLCSEDDFPQAIEPVMASCDADPKLFLQRANFLSNFLGGTSAERLARHLNGQVESKLPERRVTALLIMGMLDLNRPERDRWSPETDGIRTRLTVMLDSRAVGTPLKLQLEIQNMTDHARVIHETGNAFQASLHGLGPDFSEFPALTIGFPLPDKARTLEPGDVLVSNAELPTGSDHSLNRPGDFLIQLRNEKLPLTNAVRIRLIAPQSEKPE